MFCNTSERFWSGLSHSQVVSRCVGEYVLAWTHTPVWWRGWVLQTLWRYFISLQNWQGLKILDHEIPAAKTLLLCSIVSTSLRGKNPLALALLSWPTVVWVYSPSEAWQAGPWFPCPLSTAELPTWTFTLFEVRESKSGMTETWKSSTSISLWELNFGLHSHKQKSRNQILK